MNIGSSFFRWEDQTRDSFLRHGVYHIGVDHKGVKFVDTKQKYKHSSTDVYFDAYYSTKCFCDLSVTKEQLRMNGSADEVSYCFDVRNDIWPTLLSMLHRSPTL